MRGLDFQFAVLDQFDDFFGTVTLNAIFDGNDLFDLVATDFFDFAFVHEADIDLAFGHFIVQDILDLTQLEFGIGKNSQLMFFLINTGITAPENRNGCRFPCWPDRRRCGLQPCWLRKLTSKDGIAILSFIFSTEDVNSH